MDGTLTSDAANDDRADAEMIALDGARGSRL